MQAGDLGGRAVGEEVEDREGSGKNRPRESQRRKLRAPEVSHDRRVDEDVKRLRRQRPECGQCKADDLAVV